MDRTEALRIPSDSAYERGDDQPETKPPESPHDTPAIIRPTGISWVTLSLGLVCLTLAALVLTLQLTDLTVDWSSAAPVFVVSAGALLVMAGIASMLTRGKREG